MAPFPLILAQSKYSTSVQCTGLPKEVVAVVPVVPCPRLMMVSGKLTLMLPNSRGPWGAVF